MKYSIFLRLRQWYLNHFVPYITIQQSNEHFFISRQLWRYIDTELTAEDKSNIQIFFKHITDGNYYIMIVNPNLREEFEAGVIPEEAFARQTEYQKRMQSLKDKPRSVRIIEEVKRVNGIVQSGKLNEEQGRANLPQTFPLQLNQFGRIGFQGTQPSPAMIVYEYGLDDIVANKYHRILELTDRLPLRVKPIRYRPEVYGGRHAFILTPDVVHRPIPTHARESKLFRK